MDVPESCHSLVCLVVGEASPPTESRILLPGSISPPGHLWEFADVARSVTTRAGSFGYRATLAQGSFRGRDTRVNARARERETENLAIFTENSSIWAAMAAFKPVPLVALACCLLGGCMQNHEAKVQTALLPPPATPVRHTGRLWVELGSATWENQCRTPKGQRMVCFDGVRRSALGALERSLWTSFPDVAERDGDALGAGDYLLTLDVTIDALPPDAEGPGWSAVAAGGFRLSRDGKVLHEERLGSRSRAAFAYGGALGVGAGEVVDAFAAHIAEVLGTVAEERPLRPAPLPAVVAEVLTPAAAQGPISPTVTAPPSDVPVSDPTAPLPASDQPPVAVR